MRQKLITLCPTTYELASRKTNFSDWVRNKLRSERNRREMPQHEREYLDNNVIDRYTKIEKQTQISNRELLYHLENRTPEEIKALIAILRNGLQ